MRWWTLLNYYMYIRSRVGCIRFCCNGRRFSLGFGRFVLGIMLVSLLAEARVPARLLCSLVGIAQVGATDSGCCRAVNCLLLATLTAVTP